MTQVNKQGMRLRQTENPRKKNNFWLLQAIVAMLANVVLLLTTGKLVGITDTTVAVMAAVGAYLCIMYGLLLRIRKPHWFFYLALLILLILALVFFVLGIAYRFIMVKCPFCGDHLMGNKKIPQICPGCGSDLHKMEEYKGTEESDDDSETEAQ